MMKAYQLRNIGLAYLIIIVFFLSGCVSTKRFSTFVDTKTALVEPYEQDWLIINAPQTAQSGNDYQQLKYSFIPAILYWGWNSTIVCEISPELATSYIRNAIYHAADSLNLRSQLNGKQVVINLKEVPGRFLYEKRGDVIFLVFAYTTSTVEAISPYPIDLEAEFLIRENAVTVAKGKEVIENREQPQTNIWKSTKKFTWQYLDEYKKETDRMGTELVERIIAQQLGSR